MAQVTIATPWCTLQQAFQAAPAGSVVELRGGTYPLQQLHGAYQQPPRLTSYVTFEPFGFVTGSPEEVTLDGINLANTAYLRFQGLHFVGNDASSDVPGVLIGANTHDVQVIDSEITGQGIEDDGASDVLLQGDYVHDTTYNCAIHTQLDGAGIYITGESFTNPPVDNIQLLGNRLENNGQDAIDIGNATNVLVQGNDVSTGFPPPSAAACGYHVDEVQIENGARGPISIEDNVFHDGTQFTLRNATGLFIENNLIVRIDNWMALTADPGARVINNTWWGGNQHNTGAGSFLIADYPPGSSWSKPPFNYTNQMDGTVIENNIMRLLGNDGAPASQYSEDFDLIYGPAKNNSGIQGRHTIFGPAYFVNPTSGDFTPTGSSPAIDSADSTVAPATDFYRHARWDDPFVPNAGDGPISYVDRGAIEYQLPSTSAGSAAPSLKLSLTPALNPLLVRRGVFGLRASCNLPCAVFLAGRLYWRGTHRRLIRSFVIRKASIDLAPSRSVLLHLRLFHASAAALGRAARHHHRGAVVIISGEALGPSNQLTYRTMRAPVTMDRPNNRGGRHTLHNLRGRKHRR